MRPTLRSLFEQLVSERHLAAEDERRIEEALRAQEQATPWFVKILIGAGAWIATALFLLFLMLAGAFNAGTTIVLGVLMLVAGVAVRRLGEAALNVQCALALSLVGHGVVLVAVLEDGWDETRVGAALLAISALWVVVFPDAVHRFLSTVAAAASVLLLLYDLNADLAPAFGYAVIAAALVAAWLWPIRIDGPGLWNDLRGPVGHGLAVSALVAILPDSVGAREPGHAVIGSVILALTVVVVEVRLLRQARGRLDLLGCGAVAATLVLAAMTASVPGLLAALVVMLLGVHRREPILLGEGVVAFVFFLGWYYYALELTLLQKSLALMISGAILLAAGWFLFHRNRRSQGSGGAASGGPAPGVTS